MKMNLRQIRLLITTVTLMILAGGGGYWLGTHEIGYDLFWQGDPNKFIKVDVQRRLPEGRENVSFDLFWQVWDALEAGYFDKTKIEPAQMVYGAIKGLAFSLQDPYTVFLTPDENHQAKEDLQGAFEGVGIQLGYKQGNLVVIAPLSGTPAKQAGLKSGDVILNIDDRDTTGMSLPEAVLLIRGPEGSQVTLTIWREGLTEPLEIVVTRGTILVPSVEANLITEDNDRLVHLILTRFGDRTNGEWELVISQINQMCGLPQENMCGGLILDLRDNPGGYLLGAPAIATEFLPAGKVVVIQEFADGSQESYSVDRTGRLLKIPMVVLVNNGSASASEILAGALQEYERAKLVGEATFGKGSIQEATDLEGGSGLHITSARWLLPSGESVDETGLTPDIEVEDNPETETDEQLEKAKDLLLND